MPHAFSNDSFLPEGTGETEKYITENGISVVTTLEVPNREMQIAFLNSILKGAVSENLRTGIPWQVTMGQAAQETGWGSKLILDMYTGKDSNNLYGIKYVGSVSDSEKYVRAWTSEYIERSALNDWKQIQAKWSLNDEPIRNTGKTNAKGEILIKVIQPFKVFSSKDESIIGHSQTLNNGLYDDAMKFKDDPYKFLKAISGIYATDDSYYTSVSSHMTKYLKWDGK